MNSQIKPRKSEASADLPTVPVVEFATWAVSQRLVMDRLLNVKHALKKAVMHSRLGVEIGIQLTSCEVMFINEKPNTCDTSSINWCGILTMNSSIMLSCWSSWDWVTEWWIDQHWTSLQRSTWIIWLPSAWSNVKTLLFYKLFLKCRVPVMIGQSSLSMMGKSLLFGKFHLLQDWLIEMHGRIKWCITKHG